MHSSLLAIAATISTVAAATQGFNYGAVTRTGATKLQADFEAEFSAAKGLANTNGAFSSARLYTMIQAGTKDTPISAIPAAIAQDTKLMLGMWASSGLENINNEIAALTSAISTYGDKFTSRVNGISVGSEDLYRITPTGLANDPNSVGAGPDAIVSYIKAVRAAVAGTALSGVKIGHVDTWTAWQNGSNKAVVDAVDFLGMNTFPYFQTTEADNSINSAKALFDAAVAVTKSAGGGKPVIITETGWPVGGKQSAKAEASVDNSKKYWDTVGCSLFGTTDVYYYTLVDANTDTASQPQFGVVGTTLSTKPLFDLTCPVPSSSSSSSATSTKVAGSSPSGATTSGGVTIQTNTSAGATSSGLHTSTTTGRPSGSTSGTLSSTSTPQSPTSNTRTSSPSSSTGSTGTTIHISISTTTPDRSLTSSSSRSSSVLPTSSTPGSTIAPPPPPITVTAPVSTGPQSTLTQIVAPSSTSPNPSSTVSPASATQTGAASTITESKFALGGMGFIAAIMALL